MIEKIHEVKNVELRLSNLDIEEESDDEQLYKLCAISHSLGGAVVLIYIITRRIEEKPHRLSRMVLLSPISFHHDYNIVLSAAGILLTFVALVLSQLVSAFYIPTRFFHMLVYKLARGSSRPTCSWRTGSNFNELCCW